MQKILSMIDPLKLLDEINTLEFFQDDTGVLMAYRQSNGIPINSAQHPRLFTACIEIASLRKQPLLHMMINRMGPGIEVPFHRDYLKDTQKQGRYPHVERWHFPILTNPEAFFFTEYEQIHMEAGYWHGPVEYWNLHRVCNRGQWERTHLVVDLDSERHG